MALASSGFEVPVTIFKSFIMLLCLAPPGGEKLRGYGWDGRN